MARIPYRTESDLSEGDKHLLLPTNPFARQKDATNKKGPWDEPQNTHLAIANNPDLLESYRRYGHDLWSKTGLTERQRELGILAVAKALGSEYEWNQHVNIALETGVPQEAVESIANGEFNALSEEEVALVEYLMAFVNRSVDGQKHAELSKHFDESTIVGIGLLAGYYIGIDYMGDALDLDIEDEFVGWGLDNL